MGVVGGRLSKTRSLQREENLKNNPVPDMTDMMIDDNNDEKLNFKE